MLDTLLQTLCQDLEIARPLEPSKEGVYPLSLSSELQIDIRLADPGLSLQARLTPLPENNLEDLVTYLMRANFLGQGTGDGIISLTHDEKFLTLSHALLYDINYREFKAALEDFANYVDFWKAEIIEWKRKSEGI